MSREKVMSLGAFIYILERINIVIMLLLNSMTLKTWIYTLYHFEI
jgi:hypothetical protein